MTHLICSESLAAAVLRVAIHTSARDTELRSRRIIKLYARASNVTRHYHPRTNERTSTSEFVPHAYRGTRSWQGRVLFGNFYSGKVAKLFHVILPLKPII